MQTNLTTNLAAEKNRVARAAQETLDTLEARRSAILQNERATIEAIPFGTSAESLVQLMRESAERRDR